MLNNIDLNKIRVFFAVYDSNGVIHAAKKLRITPSAVSQSLKSLESEIGFKLFTRTTKAITPTTVGKNLYAQLVPLYSKIEKAFDEVINKAGSIIGTLRLVSPLMFGNKFVLPAFYNLRKEYKKVNLTLDFGAPEKLVPMILDNKIDFALVDYAPYLENFRTQLDVDEIYKEKLILVCSKQFYTEHVKENHSYERLSKLDHVEYAESCIAVNLWYNYNFKKNLPAKEPLIVVDNVNSIIDAVLQSMGLGFVPEYLVTDKLKSEELIKIQTPKGDYVNSIMLLKFKGREFLPLEEIFLKELKSILPKL